MKRIVISLTLSLLVINTNAQSTEDAVKAVVNNLFTAMKNADTVLLKSTFAEGAIFQTIGIDRTTSRVKVNADPVQGFVDFIGKSTAGDADERITFGAVHIDADLASVWTPYNFYFKKAFSHCGVNSFQLVRLNGVWKIQYLIDTRRKQGCNP